METEPTVITRDSEYIKLLKMTKGYNWEIKIFIQEKPETTSTTDWDKAHVARIKVIDDKMQEEWGSGTG